MPEISIITVSLNSEQTLPMCIQSVQSQTTHYEHILIDGDSIDKTLAIANQHDGHFSQIISEPDNGIYSAMNKGIRLARGEIIGILNADDAYASPGVLAAVAEAFQPPMVLACYGDLECIDPRQNNRVVRRWIAGEMKRSKFFNGWMPPHPSLFFRKRVYDDYGLYREELGTSADYDFMLRVFVKHSLPAQYIPRVLVHMRTGGASNRSISARWQANRNDARAWKLNGLKPRPWTTMAKPFRKIGQWWVRG